eukprot:7494777-Alexandrium_andersonii.AAC.1
MARGRVSALIQCGVPPAQAWGNYKRFRVEEDRRRNSPESADTQAEPAFVEPPKPSRRIRGKRR